MQASYSGIQGRPGSGPACIFQHFKLPVLHSHHTIHHSLSLETPYHCSLHLKWSSVSALPHVQTCPSGSTLTVTFCLKLTKCVPVISLCDCSSRFVPLFAQYPDFPCVPGDACPLGRYAIDIYWTSKRMLSDWVPLSYLPLEFVRFLRGQQCDVAESIRARGSERPGWELSAWLFINSGPRVSYPASLHLTSINVRWMCELLWIFFVVVHWHVLYSLEISKSKALVVLQIQNILFTYKSWHELAS